MVVRFKGFWFDEKSMKCLAWAGSVVTCALFDLSSFSVGQMMVMMLMLMKVHTYIYMHMVFFLWTSFVAACWIGLAINHHRSCWLVRIWCLFSHRWKKTHLMGLLYKSIDLLFYLLPPPLQMCVHYPVYNSWNEIQFQRWRWILSSKNLPDLITGILYIQSIIEFHSTYEIIEQQGSVWAEKWLNFWSTNHTSRAYPLFWAATTLLELCASNSIGALLHRNFSILR